MPAMFDRGAFMARFSEETAEHLANLERDLLRLEGGPPNKTLVDDMMREAHTMKGAASMMEFGEIATLSHDFEDSLLGMTSDGGTLDDASFETLFGMLDSLSTMLAASVRTVDPIAVDGTAASASSGDAPRSRADAIAAPTASAQSPTLAESGAVGVSKRRASWRAENANAPAAADVGSSSVRVGITKIDELVNLVGELVIGKTRLAERLARLEELASASRSSGARTSMSGAPSSPAGLGSVDGVGQLIDELRRATDSLAFTISQTQSSVMEVRMLPLQTVFSRFPRAVRDLAREEGKSVRLEMSGEETELDKTLLEQIRDPLMHIFRNAVGHGIESPLEREELGKSPTGMIELRAFCRGSQVIIEVQDDGRGIDSETVRSAALRKGLLTDADASRMTDSQALDLLFEPGFSTSDGVTELSGRGVGLDVVKSDISKLKGQIEISSEPGSGTTFTLRLPLTLAITSALYVEVDTDTYALPLDNIEETIRVERDSVKRIQGRDAICVRDEIIPLATLRDVLGIGDEAGAATPASMPVVVVRSGGHKLALGVDALGGRLDVVAKSLGTHLTHVKHVAGATLSGDGTVIPILDIPSIVRDAAEIRREQLARQVGDVRSRNRGKVLVVEDSVITRDLERSILQAANYEVEVASDGVEALNKLSGCRFDLVMTDVAMPRMGGIELIGRMRADEKLNTIPVIIISSQDREEDKRRGLEVGASAYLGKNSFDQMQLLDTVQRLVG